MWLVTNILNEIDYSILCAVVNNKSSYRYTLVGISFDIYYLYSLKHTYRIRVPVFFCNHCNVIYLIVYCVCLSAKHLLIIAVCSQFQLNKFCNNFLFACHQRHILKEAIVNFITKTVNPICYMFC